MNTKPINIECNPKYDEMVSVWTQLYITTELGQTGVKARGEEYLPMTEGQKEDFKEGNGIKRYTAYKTRATYYNFCAKTIKKAMGLMHSKDATVQLPENIKEWAESITIDGEDIHSLNRDINSSQLLYGRIGLLLDVTEKTKYPHVVKYSADSILVWRESVIDGIKKPEFVLLDESGYEFNMETKKFEYKEQFRLLALANNMGTKKVFYTVVLDAKEWGSWDIENPDIDYEGLTVVKTPKKISYIPFVVANIKTSTMAIEKPLLVELSDLSLSAYRADAEYRQGLYLQAFALLYFIGFSDKKLKENGVRSDGYVSTENAKAKIGYANASADGLGEMRMSLESLKVESEGNGIVISDKEGVESGKALTTRIMLQTSDLKEISLTCEESINRILKWGAEWMGVEGVCRFSANLDYNQEKLLPRDYLDLWNVSVGGGISLRNVYRWALQNDMAVEDTYEEWLENIQESLNVLGFSFGGADYDGKEAMSENDETIE